MHQIVLDKLSLGKCRRAGGGRIQPDWMLFFTLLILRKSFFFSKTTHFLTKCLISGCFIFLKSHHGWFWPGKFSIFVPPDALKMHSLTLPVLCKTFSKLPQFTLWNIMTINLWKPQSNLNWKDAASRLEKIAHSNVNYLHNLMNASWFLKKSRRKSKHLHDLLCI